MSPWLAGIQLLNDLLLTAEAMVSVNGIGDIAVFSQLRRIERRRRLRKQKANAIIHITARLPITDPTITEVDVCDADKGGTVVGPVALVDGGRSVGEARFTETDPLRREPVVEPDDKVCAGVDVMLTACEVFGMEA